MATEYLGLLVAWGRFCLTHVGFLTQKCDKWDRNQNNRQQATKKMESFLCFCSLAILKRNGMTTKNICFGKLISVSEFQWDIWNYSSYGICRPSSIFNSDDFSEEFKRSMWHRPQSFIYSFFHSLVVPLDELVSAEYLEMCGTWRVEPAFCSIASIRLGVTKAR